MECAGLDGALDLSIRKGNCIRDRDTIQSGVDASLCRRTPNLRFKPNLRHPRIARFILQLPPLRSQAGTSGQQIVQTRS
ncbi:MAG TPA: hypothetical protein DC054_25065 [Blastocatellia bacterium]|nr:hypothetical protein [Blastocatellia bacterium]